MYLRTVSRKNKDGSVVSYYQLAHSVRHPGSGTPTAQVLHTFGRADELDREVLVRLCRSIARVCGLDVFDPLDGDDAVRPRRDGGVLPAGVELHRTRTLGVPWLCEALWEQLDIGPTLRRLAARDHLRVPYERALLAMTTNRLCDPTSKLGVWDRWLETAWMPTCSGLKLAQMYEAMDFLHKHAEEVEKAVFFRTANLFNLAVDLVFFDSTTCSFAIDETDEDEDGVAGLRRFGHAKEGTWSPQVVVALAVTREGIPVRSWVFPGNTVDVTTVERVRQDLRGWELNRVLFVADAGYDSADNREELGRAFGRYVLAVRAGSVTEVKQEVLSRPGRYQVVADNLQVKEVEVGDGERRRRYVVCYNPHEAKRQAKHRAHVLAELEAELASHSDNDATAKWAAELRASGRYGRYLKVTAGSQLTIDRAKVREVEHLDGKWVLITNDDTLAPADMALAYKGLLVIERCFRALKTTQIKMRPMFHWKPERIVAHVKICVLALLIERLAEHKTGRPWPRLRDALATIQATEFHAEGRRILHCSQPNEAALAALKDLDMKPPRKVLAVEPLEQPIPST